jgi:hypothetical protein
LKATKEDLEMLEKIKKAFLQMDHWADEDNAE